jgi:predicted transglutaminase-like cysteine proteinase
MTTRVSFWFPPALARFGAWRCLFLVIGALTLPFAASATSVFATKQVSSNDLTAFTKWTSVMPRYEYEKTMIDNECVDDSCNSRRWEALLKSLKNKPVREQMQAVNKFFNAFPYIEDIDNWGVEDYWNTPYELMDHGGDCEDYAIAKYISLLRLGMPEKNMRLMIVSDLNLNGELHAILEVKVKGITYILDNQAQEVIAENDIYHYHPIYAINATTWWAYE